MTHLISSNNKRDVHSKITPPFFFYSHRCDSCSWQSTADMAAIIWKTFYAALTHGEDKGLKSLHCHTCCRTWVSWYTSTGVMYFLATRCPKIDGSQIWRVGGKKSVMTWALWGVALMACKVWHLVPWLAQHFGWGGTQSRPCSVGQLGSPEWSRVVFYHLGRYNYADSHHYLSASIALNLQNSVSNETFSEPKSGAFPAVESNGEAGDSSVKGIMDHYYLVQGTWHGHHAARVQQSTGVKEILTACCILRAKQNSCHLTQIKCEKY